MPCVFYLTAMHGMITHVVIAESFTVFTTAELKSTPMDQDPIYWQIGHYRNRKYFKFGSKWIAIKISFISEVVGAPISFDKPKFVVKRCVSKQAQQLASIGTAAGNISTMLIAAFAGLGRLFSPVPRGHFMGFTWIYLTLHLKVYS